MVKYKFEALGGSTVITTLRGGIEEDKWVINSVVDMYYEGEFIRFNSKDDRVSSLSIRFVGPAHADNNIEDELGATSISDLLDKINDAGYFASGTASGGSGGAASNVNIISPTPLPVTDEGLYGFGLSTIYVDPLSFPFNIPTCNLIAYDKDDNQLDLAVLLSGASIADIGVLKVYLESISGVTFTSNGTDTLTVATNTIGAVKYEFKSSDGLTIYETFTIDTVVNKLLETISNTVSNNSGQYLQETLTSVTPKVYAANTYKEISFIVEEGGVTVNDGTNDMVYLSTDKSIGYTFTGDKGIPQVITFTLDASSKVKVVTKAL